jgi:hypothetical protein
MFTPSERETLRSGLLELARADPRITGGAITGSAAVGREDAWSDIDLAFGVRQASDIPGALGDFSDRMYREHHAVHHVDVPSGSWIYRAFLTRSTLQVDLAFAPERDFGPRAPTFRLAFGTAVESAPASPPSAEHAIGWAWLYALHARSSMARARPWQAEYMISGMRDQILALACLRHDLPAREGRGIDRLPGSVTAPLHGTLIASLDQGALGRAFRVATEALIAEGSHLDPALARRLEPTLRALVAVPDGAQDPVS